MDLIEPGFRPKYEKICVGNKPPNAQHIFFEGLLLEEGLGMFPLSISQAYNHCAQLSLTKT